MSYSIDVIDLNFRKFMPSKIEIIVVISLNHEILSRECRCMIVTNLSRPLDQFCDSNQSDVKSVLEEMTRGPEPKL